MKRSFLFSFFILILFIGCDQKLTHKANAIENHNESINAKESKEYDGKKKIKPRYKSEGLEKEISPILDSDDPLVLAPVDGYINRESGGGGRGRRENPHNRCTQIEGNPCETGDPVPFDQGTIVCENGQPACKPTITELVYYLYIEDFIESFIEIPTSNVLVDSSTISSKYLAGRAPVYNLEDEIVGTCSASFLCMQNSENIYTDISNYLSVENGLIITWFTPTNLINLELDSIVHSMVTEAIVLASTKIGFNPLYGETFDLIVSSDDTKIFFQLTRKDE